MKKIIKTGLVIASLSATIIAFVGCASSKNSVTKEDTAKVENITELPIATIKVKDFGEIKAELYPDKAPNTVNNFIALANDGFYDGLTFHRIIKDFMNQVGDPEGNGTGGAGYNIKGEFEKNGFKENDLKHTEGVLSMARSYLPDSASSQFFIMAKPASHLDGEYAAFGKVIEGMDIVEKINSVETDASDAPEEPVIIEEIRVDTKGVDYPKPEKVK